jgi:hypothetical protein
MSEYEQIRLKNIQDRLAMFQKLGFNSMKDQLKGEKKERKEHTSRVYESREKSKRIRSKETQTDKKSVLADSGTYVGDIQGRNSPMFLQF